MLARRDSSCRISSRRRPTDFRAQNENGLWTRRDRDREREKKWPFALAGTKSCLSQYFLVVNPSSWRLDRSEGFAASHCLLAILKPNYNGFKMADCWLCYLVGPWRVCSALVVARPVPAKRLTIMENGHRSERLPRIRKEDGKLGGGDSSKLPLKI